jgi:hypothetical protein
MIQGIYSSHKNRQKSTYAQPIIDTGHTYSTINGASEVVNTNMKGQLLNIIKRFHIYNLSKQKQQMNDTFADTHNPIFNLIINNHTNSKMPHPFPHPPAYPFPDHPIT